MTDFGVTGEKTVSPQKVAGLIARRLKDLADRAEAGALITLAEKLRGAARVAQSEAEAKPIR